MTKKMFLVPLVLLTFGLASPAAASAPDRCRELGPDGYPAYCDAIGERDAPFWGEAACCVESRCVELGAAGCPSGTQEYTCQYAEPDGQGNLTCLYLVPYYCEENPCPSNNDDLDFAAPPQIQAHLICCYDGGCYDTQGGICGGAEYICFNGVSNEDGTVTCFDEDVPS